MKRLYIYHLPLPLMKTDLNYLYHQFLLHLDKPFQLGNTTPFLVLIKYQTQIIFL